MNDNMNGGVVFVKEMGENGSDDESAEEIRWAVLQKGVFPSF